MFLQVMPSVLFPKMFRPSKRHVFTRMPSMLFHKMLMFGSPDISMWTLTRWWDSCWTVMAWAVAVDIFLFQVMPLTLLPKMFGTPSPINMFLQGMPSILRPKMFGPFNRRVVTGHALDVWAPQSTWFYWECCRLCFARCLGSPINMFLLGMLSTLLKKFGPPNLRGP